MHKIYGFTAMLTATMLWGFAFSAQSKGMDYTGPALFNTLRSATGFIALLILCTIIEVWRKTSASGDTAASNLSSGKYLIPGGILCGIALGIASNLQQMGLEFTTVGKTGFLTALYIIIVPVLGIFFKRRTSSSLWIAVLLALSGTYLLCGGTDRIGKGEILVIAASCVYSIHIMLIDHYINKCDCLKMSCLQFATASVISLILTIILGEAWILSKIYTAVPFILFCGIGSGAAAFTLQMVSQKYLHPVTASLLMSLEAVFAVLGGWIFLGQTMNLHETAGCAIIFIAIILTQIPFSNNKQPTQTILKNNNN